MSTPLMPPEPTPGATPTLSIVVPVYRSEDCIEPLVEAIHSALSQEQLSYEVVLVNDGSPDESWVAIERATQTHREVVGIDLRRNYGQDNAIMAGLRVVRGGFVVIMDDDLQHDPKDIPAMVAKAVDGFDVVYGRFRHRQHKTWKRLGSWAHGKLADWVIEKPAAVYMSPFKVLRREVVELICEYDGPFPYVDGLLFQVTNRITQIDVEHHPRHAGESTYSFFNSVRVTLNLFVGFSVRPLRLVTAIGTFFAVLGLMLAAGVLIYRLVAPSDFPAEAVGWASLMIAILVIGGAQMIFFGVLGEYSGRTYLNVNRKPQSAIRTLLTGGGLESEPIPDEAKDVVT